MERTIWPPNIIFRIFTSLLASPLFYQQVPGQKPERHIMRKTSINQRLHVMLSKNLRQSHSMTLKCRGMRKRAGFLRFKFFSYKLPNPEDDDWPYCYGSMPSRYAKECERSQASGTRCVVRVNYQRSQSKLLVKVGPHFTGYVTLHLPHFNSVYFQTAEPLFLECLFSNL